MTPALIGVRGRAAVRPVDRPFTAAYADGSMRGRAVRFLCLPCLLCLLCLQAALTGCSLNRFAMETVAGMVSGSGSSTVMAGDADAQLVGEAMPFTLKLHELLLAELPEDPPLLLATGRAFVVYAALYVQRPAERLPSREIERRVAELARAKALYLRAREYLLTGTGVRHPGFRERLAEGDVAGALALTDASSIDYLYWLGAAWLAAVSTDPLDITLSADTLRAGALLEQVVAWDSNYSGGAVHDVLIAYYGGIYEALGGSAERARRHFELAVAASGGARARPYVAMAGVAIRAQDAEEFRSLLQQALAVPMEVEEYRLQNTLDQEHAAWLLAHMEDFFLDP